MPIPLPRGRILLVEDEVLIALSEIQAFKRAGYEVEHVLDGESALVRALSRDFELVLMDIDLGSGMDGGEAARRIRAAGGPPVVFLSSRAEDAALEKTRDSGGYGYIIKGSGDRIVLASVRMALGLARALRSLSESEERWASLAETAPDYIVSMDADRRILFVNRPIPGFTIEGIIGHDYVERVAEPDRPRVERMIESVFLAGRAGRILYRAVFSSGLERDFEAYIGPVFEGDRVVSATAVVRDVTTDRGLLEGLKLDAGERREELEAAIASCDFGSVKDYLRSFQRLTGVHASILSRGGWDVLANAVPSKACSLFHNSDAKSREACIESNTAIESALASVSAGGFAEHRCANGLRDMALPLFVEGMHWGSLFIGQFLYEDDEVDEAAFSARAREHGWDAEEYLAAIREVPRFSREAVAGYRETLASFARVVTELAQGAYRARLLERFGAAAQSARDESDRRYRLLAENAADVIWTLDPKTLRFSYISPSVEALRGVSVEEAMNESLEESLSPESFARVSRDIADFAQSLARSDSGRLSTYSSLLEQRRKDGGYMWIEVSVKPVLDEAGKLVDIVGVTRDASERIRFESSLRAALADKDRLYAELQHRIKNSLALISSLLSLSAGQAKDDAARAGLEEAHTRVRSVGLLYEQLYRTKSVEDIELGSYLSEVLSAVMGSSLSPRGTRVDTDCESFRISTDRAVSVGLLLYELAANAAKHAFPSSSGGRIRLGLRLEGGEVRLSLEDDGRGLPPDFDLGSSSGLGSVLVNQLARQLGGRASAGKGIGGAGAGFFVRFPLERT
jgi:PAS domain S-box